MKNIDKKSINEYLADDSLFYNFDFYLKLHPTRKEVLSYKPIAQDFSAKFNKLPASIKVKAFASKLNENGLADIIQKNFHAGRLRDATDFTATIDYRFPRAGRVNHQVLKLVFENKSFFIKELILNDFEQVYQRLAKKLGLPFANFIVVPLSTGKQIFICEEIKGNILKNVQTANIEQLAKHGALADFLKKGGRDFTNYIVDSKNSIYAIDNEFLYNKKDIWLQEMKKKYNELFFIENSSHSLLEFVDKLIVFVRAYAATCNELHYKRPLLWANMDIFLAINQWTEKLDDNDRRGLMKLLQIKNYGHEITALLQITNGASQALKKAIRQSSVITKELFGFEPMLYDSINYDNKTFVLKEALDGEAKRAKNILEIGPGCNASLSLYLKRKFPKSNLSCAEINADFVKNIKKTAQANHLKVDARVSDIVKNAAGKYDLIFWNIPFVTSNRKHLARITGNIFQRLSKYATENDDGTNLVKRYLNEAPKNLSQNGLLMFASNTFYLPENKTFSLIKESKFKLYKVYKQKGNTAKAYLLKLKSH